LEANKRIIKGKSHHKAKSS